jgi:hypothetical protein
MRGEDHGALDYWAMLFGLICFLAAWMWLGDWSLTARLTVMTIGLVGLFTTVWLIRRQ